MLTTIFSDQILSWNDRKVLCREYTVGCLGHKNFPGEHCSVGLPPELSQIFKKQASPSVVNKAAYLLATVVEGLLCHSAVFRRLISSQVVPDKGQEEAALMRIQAGEQGQGSMGLPRCLWKEGSTNTDKRPEEEASARPEEGTKKTPAGVHTGGGISGFFSSCLMTGGEVGDWVGGWVRPG